jgi:hypothetical protein
MYMRELEIAHELVARLRGPIERLHLADPGLAVYLRRAACQLAVSLNEARYEDEAQQVKLIERAEENVAEIFGALELAEAWGHMETEVVAGARLLLDAEMALLGRTPVRLAG